MNNAGPLQIRAAQFAQAAGFDLNRVALKVKESPACSRRQTTIPAYDVSVRVEGATRGRHIGTILLFDWPTEEFRAWMAR